MRYAVLVGWVWLGAGVVACGGLNREVRLREEHLVGASSGAGGAAELDTGTWAARDAAAQSRQAWRKLYEQVAEELRLEPWPVTARSAQARAGEGVGGAGRAGGERRSCAEVLAANEPAAVLSGRLDFAGDGLLTLHVPGKGPVKLRTDESTCTVQARQARSPESLLEGTETRVSYVMEDGLPTARVVRAEPVRFTH
jgi:hypothetical protein